MKRTTCKTLTAAQAIAIANKLIVQMAEMVGTIGELAIANDKLQKEVAHMRGQDSSELIAQVKLLQQQIAELRG